MQNPFKEHIYQISAVVLAIGIAMLIISVLGLWFKELIPQLKSVLEQLSWWNLWLLIISPFIVIIGGYYFIEQIYNRREFKKLIKTNSKREFLTHIDRLEELTYLLTKKHRKILHEKKKEFRIE